MCGLASLPKQGFGSLNIGVAVALPVKDKATMKSISASIVVLSGALVLVGASFISHDQTQGFLQFVGGVVGLTGLVVWFQTIRQSKE